MWNRNFAIGIFVVTGITLFTLAIFMISNQRRAFGRHISLYTEFANIDGLVKGSKVLVAGFDAGEITDIGVPDSPSSRFRLKLRIEQRVSSLVRTDSLVTIGTEGVVGDKFVLIHLGSSNAPEATPFTTLPSKEPFDMADLLEKSAGLLNGASGTMKVVADNLNGTLDAVTNTVNNADDLVIGVKQGKGTVGMLFRDETTATNIRDATANAQQTAASLNDASRQADALVSDLHSRGLGQKADQTMSSVQSAASNIDTTSQELHQTVTAALGPDDQGVDAGENIRQSLSNLNSVTGNMAEDTEALKHEFFFRGFFRHRGYYSLTHVDQATYRSDKLFANPGNPRVWLETAELFEQKQGGSEALSPAGKRQIEAAIVQLGDAAIGGALVVEGYSTAGDPGSQLAASRDRAILVRQYLHTQFQLDLQNIGTVPLGGVPPPAVHKGSWDGVCIVLLKASFR
jgi:phospholipid/cholesterol/gamma-HCH transport system substrate-binding protein